VYLAFETVGRAPLAGMRRAPMNPARPPRKITHLKSTKLQSSYSSTLGSIVGAAAAFVEDPFEQWQQAAPPFDIEFAHHVIDHRKPIAPEVAALGIGPPGFVFSISHTADHLKDIAELIAPQGRLALINNEPLELASFMRKSVSIHWESMFTRSLMETADMAEQHALLEQVAALVDAGKIRTTIAENFGIINAANLKRAHAFLETGKARGKVVLEGF